MYSIYKKLFFCRFNEKVWARSDFSLNIWYSLFIDPYSAIRDVTIVRCGVGGWV